MKINTAFVCADCEEVTQSSQRCPDCASRELYPLSAWLNRHPEAEPESRIDNSVPTRLQ